MDVIETLRDTLLVALIILLVIVLYRRLLTFLNKQTATEAYATFNEKPAIIEENTLSFQVDFPNEAHATIEVRDASQEVIMVPLDQVLAAGEHQLSFYVGDLKEGKYTYHLKTHNQDVSRFFRI